MAWPGFVWGEDRIRSCPCELQFRVDRFVAGIEAFRSRGPVIGPLEEPDPRHMAIARIVAERMRALPQQPADSGG